MGPRGIYSSHESAPTTFHTEVLLTKSTPPRSPFDLRLEQRDWFGLLHVFSCHYSRCAGLTSARSAFESHLQCEERALSDYGQTRSCTASINEDRPLQALERLIGYHKNSIHHSFRRVQWSLERASYSTLEGALLCLPDNPNLHNLDEDSPTFTLPPSPYTSNNFDSIRPAKHDASPCLSPRTVLMRCATPRTSQ